MGRSKIENRQAELPRAVCSDLGVELCDLRSAAFVMVTVLEAVMSDPEDRGHFKMFLLNDEQIEALNHSVYEVKAAIMDLRDKWGEPE